MSKHDESEPTQEQVERERERAHAVSCLCRADSDSGRHNGDCDRIAAALARRALEARDEALGEAERRICDAVVEASMALNGKLALALHRIAAAIRALRGARTDA